MSRSEERQRIRAQDFALLRNKNGLSRSRSRSRSRDRSNRRKKSPSTTPSNDRLSRSHSRSKPRSHSRSHSRWGSRSRSREPQNPSTHDIPTTVISSANTQRVPAMAAIVDPPNHSHQSTKPQQPPPPPQHIQYNIDEGTLRKFCQPYNMEELVKMICNTAYVNRDFYDILVEDMKKSSKWCKLFIHGLPWTTTQETLFAAFSKFGQILECVILKDRNGQSKGYGFINYSNAQEAINAINAGPQYIDGRMVGSDLAWKGRKNRGQNNNSTNLQQQQQQQQHQHQHQQQQRQRAVATNSSANTIGNPLQARIIPTAGGVSQNGLGGPLSLRRLFVYSLLYTTNDETLNAVFSQYGELEEAVIIKDKNNEMKSKGYGFVIYKHVKDANEALKQPHKMIDGRTVHCSLAIDGKNGQGNNVNVNNNNNANNNNLSINNPINNSNVALLNSINSLTDNHALLNNQIKINAAQNPISALSAVLQQQQALQSYDPYQQVLYSAAALNANTNPTQQLLQQLLAQQLHQQQQQQQQHQLLSAPNTIIKPETNDKKPTNMAPAPIHPN